MVDFTETPGAEDFAQSVDMVTQVYVRQGLSQEMIIRILEAYIAELKLELELEEEGD
jgi:hypothetical protein